MIEVTANDPDFSDYSDRVQGQRLTEAIMKFFDFEFEMLIRTGLKLFNDLRNADLFGRGKDPATQADVIATLSSPISLDSASTPRSNTFYYSHFRGQGRDMLAKALGADDPFRMLPYDILERVLANGEPPQVDTWQAYLWRDMGQVYEIRLARRNFLVAISRDKEEINVQEVRAEAYPTVEFSGSARRPSRRPRLAPSKIKTPRNSAFPLAMQTATNAAS